MSHDPSHHDTHPHPHHPDLQDDLDPESDFQEPPQKRARAPRATQACKACRDSKLRCDLGDPDAPKDPPCRRCLRTGRECSFVGSHLNFKPRKMTPRTRPSIGGGQGAVAGPAGLASHSGQAGGGAGVGSGSGGGTQGGVGVGAGVGAGVGGRSSRDSIARSDMGSIMNEYDTDPRPPARRKTSSNISLSPINHRDISASASPTQSTKSGAHASPQSAVAAPAGPARPRAPTGPGHGDLAGYSQAHNTHAHNSHDSHANAHAQSQTHANTHATNVHPHTNVHAHAHATANTQAGGNLPVPAVPHQLRTAASAPSTRGSSAEAPFGLATDAGGLETPADALRILCAAADGDKAPAAPEEPGPSSRPRQGYRLWIRWGPVREGLLTTEEAEELLGFYAQNLSPMYPVVPTTLFLPEHFPELIDEPFLLAAICLSALRFQDLGPSFDLAEPSRSRVIQGKLANWLMARLGFLSMGNPSLRTIGTVEALLILSEWPPRALLLQDPAERGSSTAPPATPTKLFDDLTWTLTGLALRIAQELSLQDETTYVNDKLPPWRVRRRIETWISCLSADRHVSVRLGRVSLVQAKMSTTWWDATNTHMYSVSDGLFIKLSDKSWKEVQGISEMSHQIGLLQDLLYLSPRHTRDLMRTRRYEGILHRLKPELDGIAQWLSDEDIDYDVLEESVPGREAQEIRELRMRVEVDYVRLYANAISLRAAHLRVSRWLKPPPSGPRTPTFSSNVLRAAEGTFILEADSAAVSLIQCGVALHKRGVLRYCPGRQFLRMMFASVFLMKAMSFGAVLHPEDEIVELQYALIAAFREAAIDSEHIAAQLASLLSRLFPSRARMERYRDRERERSRKRERGQNAEASRSNKPDEHGPGHGHAHSLSKDLAHGYQHDYGDDQSQGDRQGREADDASRHTDQSPLEPFDPLSLLDFDFSLPEDMGLGNLDELGIDPATLQNTIGCNPDGLVAVIEGLLGTASAGGVALAMGAGMGAGASSGGAATQMWARDNDPHRR